MKNYLAQTLQIDENALQNALRLACRWITDVAQVQTHGLTTEKNRKNHQYESWKGAIRGEYSVAAKEWDFFCPVWHTGQAVKALVAAYQTLADETLLHAAKGGGEFLGNARIRDKNHPHFGLILATEDSGRHVNTSAVLECMDGLFALSEATGDKTFDQWAIDAGQWVLDHAYIQGKGLFRDFFFLETMAFGEQEEISGLLRPNSGRPLFDDGIFLKLYRKTGNKAFRTAFYETADRLLAEEDPPGNWISFGPCRKETGVLHPRHAYWWGLPMLYAYQDSKEEKYLDCVRRSAAWYAAAQRKDGGLFRNTYTDFNTDSFGHATSGIACGAILWFELYQETGDTQWLAPLKNAVQYCMNMQFTNPEDENLTGAILEKVHPPGGSDRSPYHIRDLGTIFFIQAAANLL